MSEVILRKIKASDTDNIVRWRNSDSVKRNLFTQSELTAEQHLGWLKSKVETGSCAQYIIVVSENSTNTDIGTVFIKNIDRQSNKGEFGIFIGEADARGKGYAKLATIEILKIAFEKMMLNRVFLTVMADNISGIKVYEKAGFLCEGVLREDYLRGNTYVDVLVMGVTKKMWLKFGNISQIGGVLLPNQIAICATLPDSNARRTVA
ncbi:MAG: GNAT family N-acetyltransferase [Pelotomaculaceae bacterium]|jgi:UDP-4-amino-4,6-dideoxy-N-acetyl-beta-L-altrosamine N-acetyltransferase|nr:GNAT family N-acetyltransferase [Clostridiaceae bacterium]